MPRPQFSLPGLLIFTALIAVLLAATRLVSREFLPVIPALACVVYGILGVFVIPAMLPAGKGAERKQTLLLGVTLILLGIVATLVGGVWLMTTLLDIAPPG